MIMPHFTTAAGLAGLAALGAGIAAAWSQIKRFGYYLVGLIIGRVMLKEDAGEAVMAYCVSLGKRSPLGLRVFGGFETYVHPKRWRESVAYEGFTSDPVMLRHAGRFVVMSLINNDNNNSSNIGGYNSTTTVMIRYLRGFFNPEKFVLAAIDYYNSQKRQQELSDGELMEHKKRLSRFRIVRAATQTATTALPTSNESHGAPSKKPRFYGEDEKGIERLLTLGVYRLLKWKREDLQIKPEEGQSPFTGYPFPKEVADAIEELNCWLSHEKWFRSKSIPWRRGWLLHGLPGTGKSTLTRALGMSFGLPVYVYDLSQMTNNEFLDAWESMLTETPVLALFEDLDTVFEGRKFIGSGRTASAYATSGAPHLTFDCLLNCISGVKATDGVFLVVTTNHLKHIDPALGVPDITGKSSRPGRIDRAIYLGPMQEPERLILAKHILSDYPELVQQTVLDGEGETAAQFQSRCARIATSQFWMKKA